MKKLLLSATVILGSILSIQAQTTIMSQPFGTTTIPTGWSQNTPAVAADNWKFTNAWGSNMASYFSMQGYCASIDDWDNNPSQTTANYDTLFGPTMNCSAYTSVYISLNYWFYNDDAAETAYVLYSINGGVTWLSAVNLPNTQSTATGWSNGTIFDISAYAAGQANVMIAFAYYDGVGSALNNGYVACGMCVQDVDVYSPANYEVEVTSQNLNALMQVGTAYNFTGSSFNQGGTGITSMTMNYSVNNGTPVSQTIPSISGFNGLTSYNWSMNSTSSAFTPSAVGLYNVKYWASNLNASNPNVSTDTLTATFYAVDTVVTKQSLYEEQTGQSCVFCMLAAPNMDSVYNNNATTSNIIRYHVPIPARDFMYAANTTPCIEKENYYAITGAPWGDLDGTYLNPSLYGNPPESEAYSSVTLQAENTIGSPFKIDITKSTFNPSTDSFNVAATIKSYGSFPAGLKAQVALCIDSITYTYDLSMDDPQQSFAAPIGTGASGYSYTDCPDYFYDFVLKFTHVCEQMFPNSGDGTNLAAFTPGSSQNISFSWKKNHPWGLYDKGAARDSDFYDSSATGQFVVFVQTNSAVNGFGAQYVFQSASAPVTGMKVLGIQQLSNDGIQFEIYPNPTNNNTTLAFKLDKDQNVNVNVFNMLGENVFSDNAGSMSAGTHTLVIDGANLQNGVYFVRLSSDNSTSTQKLVIQH